MLICTILSLSTLFAQGCALEEEERVPQPPQEYEVVSVSRYTRTRTNPHGGVINQDICYYFEYIDNGKIKTQDNFIHRESGNTKIDLSEDYNKYIIYNDHHYLCLTKETMKNLSYSEVK